MADGACRATYRSPAGGGPHTRVSVYNKLRHTEVVLCTLPERALGDTMEKPAQNIQDSFLNNARKDKIVLTIYLMSGVKLSGRIKSFDKYSLVLETNNQEQLDLQARHFHRGDSQVGAHLFQFPAGRGADRRCGRTGRRRSARGLSGGLSIPLLPNSAAERGGPGRRGTEIPRHRRKIAPATTIPKSLWRNSPNWPKARAPASRTVLSQSRPAPDAATLIGRGKVENWPPQRRRPGPTWSSSTTISPPPSSATWSAPSTAR